MKTNDKKQLIAEKYLMLLEKNPNDKITVSMLIRECGLSRQTFYYHFRDILDVVVYIFRESLSESIVKCGEDEDPRDGIRRFLISVDESRRLIKNLGDSRYSKEIARCVTDTIAEIAGSILESENDAADRYSMSDIKFALSLYAHGIQGYILEKIDKNEEIDIEKLTDQLYRFLTGEIRVLGRR